MNEAVYGNKHISTLYKHNVVISHSHSCILFPEHHTMSGTLERHFWARWVYISFDNVSIDKGPAIPGTGGMYIVDDIQFQYNDESIVVHTCY